MREYPRIVRRAVFSALGLLAFFAASGAAQAQVAEDAYEDLIKATRRNDIPAVRRLLERGMDVETAEPGGNTLLMISAQEGDLDMARFLVARGARLRARNAFGDTALMFAALKGNLALVDFLIAKGAEVNSSGWTALHYCAWGGWTEVCRHLLQHGAHIDALSPNGSTPLMIAARQGQLEAARLLIWEHADLDIRNDAGASALRWAIEGGHTEIAQLLKQAGAKE